ncbi:MAG: proteasome assembly chaperone family protein [Thermoplasmata archaeon]|nr:proteasome assembly chaperone family protein [Thermoplasmata archaeon]
MEDIIIKYYEEPKLNKPVLVEGLPGVGNVGKLAAEHLVSKLKAKKFASIFSKHFPPQVLIGEDGVIRLVSNDLYYYKSKKGQDLIILSGDYQGTSQEGQYDLSYEVLDILEKYGGNMIYTLGGWSVGKIIAEPRVLGAASSLEFVEKLKAAGVEFSKDEPAGGIVGAAGLLLGLGQIRDMEAACLMGETSGYFSDPRSAQTILAVLGKMLDIKIDFKELEEHAKEIDDLTSKLNEIKPPMEPSGDELKYIG